MSTHFSILLGAARIRNCCLFNFSVRTYNAIAVFNATWIEQVSVSCASPDSGAYILDFKNATLLSVTTLLSIIVSLLNFVVNSRRSLPCRPSLKIITKLADFVLQPLNFGVSLYFWFKKFQSDSAIFWILLVWWTIRILQSMVTEIRKWCKSPREARGVNRPLIELPLR